MTAAPRLGLRTGEPREGHFHSTWSGPAVRRMTRSGHKVRTRPIERRQTTSSSPCPAVGPPLSPTRSNHHCGRHPGCLVRSPAQAQLARCACPYLRPGSTPAYTAEHLPARLPQSQEALYLASHSLLSCWACPACSYSGAAWTSLKFQPVGTSEVYRPVAWQEARPVRVSKLELTHTPHSLVPPRLRPSAPRWETPNTSGIGGQASPGRPRRSPHRPATRRLRAVAKSGMVEPCRLLLHLTQQPYAQVNTCFAAPPGADALTGTPDG